MKKLTLLLIALIGVLTMNAKVVTEQEALLKAQRFMQGKRFMQGRRLNQSQTQARRVAQKNVPAYYIFNVEHEDGFVIVSGDDRTPEILGYSEHGNLNPDNAPDNVKWWLSEYERQIEWLLNSADEGAVRRAAETSHRDGWAAIEPLVKSQWNQDFPYNDLCPTLDGEKTPTGCVATAMAQIMNYHQWPVTGKGSNSYDWNEQMLSMDFSDVTFDWGNMQNIYSYSEEDDSFEAKNAVATLMYACGISVNMNYDIKGSGAFSEDAESALCQYFGYEANNIVNLDYYELSEWENMVYTDLVNKRPVYYSGMSFTGSHAFVCDGYSTDGLFHINWGWGGWCDGYFLLSALDPYGGENGYNYWQSITYGIRPVQKALINGVYYNLGIKDGQASILPSDERYYTGNIVIPSTVTYEGKTYNVTSIGSQAFSDCSSLTSINIPESVTSIGKNAFSGCSSLTSINIPNGVTSIGWEAFRDCSSLTSIVLPEGVTLIDVYAFSGCSSLASVNIPNGVTRINRDAFNGCSSLTSIVLPNSVTKIGERAFSGCRSLTSLSINDGVMSIGQNAFAECDKLISVTIPKSVTSIDVEIFKNCPSLTSIVIDKDNPVYDSRENCNAIIETAYNTLYQGCTNTIIPSSVTKIGPRAFLQCAGLTSVTIPNNVEYIDESAFADCCDLTSVISLLENPFAINFNVFDSWSGNNIYLSAVLYCPNPELYKETDGWKNFADIRPLEEEKVTLAIGDAHYATFIAPFDVKIPANVTAYTVSGIKEDGEILQMDELTRTIPANTPVVLYSNDMVDETVTGIRTTQETTYTHGLLTGVYTEIQAPSNSYVLQNQNGEVAFYYVAEGSQPAVKANRAYLTVPNANGIKAFRFGIDDETTGIQATVGGQESKAVIYDMTGRRVEKAVKGMYIIDGKKVMVK